MTSCKVIKITNDLFLVTGGFTFSEACEHAKALDGSVAIIENNKEFIDLSKYLFMNIDHIDEFEGNKCVWIGNFETDKFLNWKDDIYNCQSNEFVKLVWNEHGSEWITESTDDEEKKGSYLLYKELKVKLHHEICILNDKIDRKDEQIHCLKKKLDKMKNMKHYYNKCKQKSDDDLWYAKYCYECMAYHDGNH